MTLPPPLVSVIVPCFNYGHLVGRAIESIKQQTLNNFECIVVNDGSTDNSEQMILRAIKGDKRFKYLHHKNCGVSYTRNRGISEARGVYISCLDADDAIAPNFLEVCATALQKNPLLGIAYTGLMQVYPNSGEMKPGGWPPDCNFDQQIKGRNQVPTACMYRRVCWEQLGGYRSRYVHPVQGCGSEDANFFLRVGANGWQMRRVTKDPLFLYTLGGRTWDKAHYEKPEWTNWHPWTVDEVHPFASIATPKNGESHPVYQYDVPVVSVVIPVGPLHPYMVVDALDSLEAQTFRRWEGVLVNDSGVEIDLSPWPYLTVINTDGGKGAGFARNRGTEASKGQYIVYLDADDFLQSSFLFQTLQAAEGNPGHWVYTDMYILKPTGAMETYQCEEWDPAILWRSGMASVTSLYPRSMWEAVGGFDEELYREDWDFHLRLAKKGYCGIRLPKPLFTYRHATGDRRRSGSHRKEIDLLHRMYNREELMRGCSGCGKRRINRSDIPAQPPIPGNWATKADLGWPQVEFTGGNKNALVFKGKGTGRKYKAGNNQYHKVIRVHPSDYQGFLSMSCFKEYTGGDGTTMTAPPAPKPAPRAPRPAPKPTSPAKGGKTEPVPLAKPEPKAAMPEPLPFPEVPEIEVKGEEKPLPTGDVNIAEMKIREVLAHDWSYFSAPAIDLLIEQERTAKNRSTVVSYLERQKRAGGPSTSKEKIKGDAQV